MSQDSTTVLSTAVAVAKKDLVAIRDWECQHPKHCGCSDWMRGAAAHALEILGGQNEPCEAQTREGF